MNTTTYRTSLEPGNGGRQVAYVFDEPELFPDQDAERAKALGLYTHRGEEPPDDLGPGVRVHQVERCLNQGELNWCEPTKPSDQVVRFHNPDQLTGNGCPHG